MIGLTDLEVYNSIFNINTTNSKFKLYKFPDEKAGGVSYERVRDEIVKDLDISSITDADLQDDIVGLVAIKECKEQVSKRMEDEQYMRMLSSCTSSVFQDIETFLRAQIDLVEYNVRLVLDEYNSSFVTHINTPGIYTFKDLHEALFNILQLEYPESSSEIVIEVDITRKTNLVVKSGFIAIRFDENSVF